MCISDSGVPKEISQLCVKLYAIKDVSSLVADEIRFGLHQVGKARVKKEKSEISITPFENGLYHYTIRLCCSQFLFRKSRICQRAVRKI